MGCQAQPPRGRRINRIQAADDEGASCRLQRLLDRPQRFLRAGGLDDEEHRRVKAESC